MTRDMNNSETKTCPHKNNQASKQTNRKQHRRGTASWLEFFGVIDCSYKKKTEANNY